MSEIEARNGLFLVSGLNNAGKTRFLTALRDAKLKARFELPPHPEPVMVRWSRNGIEEITDVFFAGLTETEQQNVITGVWIGGMGTSPSNRHIEHTGRRQHRTGADNHLPNSIFGPTMDGKSGIDSRIVQQSTLFNQFVPTTGPLLGGLKHEFDLAWEGVGKTR